MRRLRRISTPRSPTPLKSDEPLTEPSSAVRLRRLPSITTSAPMSQSPSTLRPLPRLRSTPAPRILDWDIETVAAGYGDPQWVPNTTTVWAYGWVGEDTITVDALPVAAFYDLDARREFIRPLLDAIDEASILTGHNLLRWDCGVIVAECLLLNLPVPRPRRVQDTMRLPKARGFKKGQDNLGAALDVLDEKMPLSWAQWQAAYAEPDLATVKERCASDVRMHMQIRAELADRGWLRNQWWSP